MTLFYGPVFRADYAFLQGFLLHLKAQQLFLMGESQWKARGCLARKNVIKSACK